VGLPGSGITTQKDLELTVQRRTQLGRPGLPLRQAADALAQQMTREKPRVFEEVQQT